MDDQGRFACLLMRKFYQIKHSKHNLLTEQSNFQTDSEFLKFNDDIHMKRQAIPIVILKLP